MKPLGLITTSNKSEQPIGSLIRARNIVNKYKSGKTNELGTLEVANYSGMTTGVIVTPKEEIIFTVGQELVDGDLVEVSTIRRLKQATSTIALKSLTLGFSLENPIQGVFEYNFRGDLILVWWEGIDDDANNIRTLNLDCLPFDIDPTTKFIVEEAKIKLLDLNPDTCPPLLSFAEVGNTGGQLLTGNYSIFTQYESSDGIRTAPFVNGTTINIYSQDIQSDIVEVENDYVGGSDYQLIDFEGAVGGETTSKRIRLLFSNIDTNFSKLVVGAVRLSNGVTTAFTEIEIDITSDTLEYILTGNVDRVISLEEVLGLNAAYIKAESGTVLDKRLYLGNLKEQSVDIEGLQEIVNSATVTWDYTTPVSIESDIPTQSYKDPNVQLSITGLFPDEVYALYIGFFSHKGQWTILHLPGRTVGTTDWENTSNESSTDSLARPSTNLTGLDEDSLISDILAANPTIFLSEMEEALSVDENIKFFQIFDTAGSDGTMGFWENATEVYPECFPDLAGQKVRHHKTPSLEHLKRRLSQEVFFDPSEASIDFLEGLSTRVLTININNLVIPEDIADKFCYWGVFYAKRDFNNSSHIGLGYLSNKQYASEEPVALPLSHTATSLIDSARFNSFSLLKDIPSINPNYLKVHFKIPIPNVDDIDTTVNYISNNLWHYDTLDTNIDESEYEAFRKITGSRFYPNDVIITGDDGDGNLLGEETFKIDFNLTLENTNHGLLMASIYSYKPDMYSNYNTQELVFTGKLNLVQVDTSKPYGGDCIVSRYSFKLHNVMPTPSEEINPYLAMLYTVPAYDVANIWLRQEGLEGWEKFHPKSMLHEYETVEADNEIEYLQHGNYYEYNRDFSNRQVFSFYRRFVKTGCAQDSSCSTDIVTSFPYRIARSLIVPDESSEIRFRVFRANDFSELDRNTGAITSVTAYNNGLFVTTEFGAFYFDPQVVLETEAAAVALYGSDLFLQKPNPLIESTGGFMGCKSKYTAILCPSGVAFMDASVGRLYLFDGQISELTSDIRYDFETLFKRVIPYLDNPFDGTGATMGYDKDYHRLVITTVISDGKVVNNGSTLSYDLSRKEWVSYHDYIPTLFYFSNKGLRAIYNSPVNNTTRVWWHNENPAFPGVYYGTKYSSYIDIVLAGVDSSFIVRSINWLTQALFNNDLSHTKTVGQILVYNQNQSSGIINLKLQKSLSNLAGANLSKRANGYIFGMFRDIVINPDEAIFLSNGSPNVGNLNINKVLRIRPFLSNYLVARLIILNESFVEITIVDVGVDVINSTNSTTLKKI